MEIFATMLLGLTRRVDSPPTSSVKGSGMWQVCSLSPDQQQAVAVLGGVVNTSEGRNAPRFRRRSTPTLDLRLGSSMP